MADEPDKPRKAAVGEHLKAMFKAAEKLPLPDKLRDAAAGEADAQPAPKQRRRKP